MMRCGTPTARHPQEAPSAPRSTVVKHREALPLKRHRAGAPDCLWVWRHHVMPPKPRGAGAHLRDASRIQEASRLCASASRRAGWCGAGGDVQGVPWRVTPWRRVTRRRPHHPSDASGSKTVVTALSSRYFRTTRPNLYLARKMKLIFWGIICIYMVKTQTDARPFQEKEDAKPFQDKEDPYRQPELMPYWPFRSNDFWAYVEYFRTLGAYHRINEMARTFFAHQPLANTLGYDAPYHEY